MDYAIADNCVKNNKNNIILIATGGTIAGSGKKGKNSGYTAGVISAEELCFEVRSDINLVPIQLCNVDSCDMSYDYIRKIDEIIRHYSKNDDVKGFVITHGTDTMAESAFLLGLIADETKPIVITGSMHPMSARLYDGFDNLYNAVCTAADEKAKGLGVLVVFSDLILAGRYVQKQSSFRLGAFGMGDMGALGYVADGKVELYNLPVIKRRKLKLSERLPLVAIVHFSLDCDIMMLRYALNNYDGVVIEGAGDGGFSKKWLEEIKNSYKPIVRCSKVNGYISDSELLDCTDKVVSSGGLSADKSRILLQLMLANDIDIRRFGEF